MCLCVIPTWVTRKEAQEELHRHVISITQMNIHASPKWLLTQIAIPSLSIHSGMFVVALKHVKRYHRIRGRRLQRATSTCQLTLFILFTDIGYYW